MHINHLITQLLYDWNNFHITMSVGLESNLFRLKPFKISKIFANIDMMSGVYTKFFWETVET